MEIYTTDKYIGTLKVKSVIDIKCSLGSWGIEIEPSDKKTLLDLGLWDASNNTCFHEKPTQEQIVRAAWILEKYYGRLTAVCIWFHKSINMWRIVFGN